MENYFINLETGEVLTYKEMIRQGIEEYDLTILQMDWIGRSITLSCKAETLTVGRKDRLKGEQK